MLSLIRRLISRESVPAGPYPPPPKAGRSVYAGRSAPRAGYVVLACIPDDSDPEDPVTLGGVIKEGHVESLRTAVRMARGMAVQPAAHRIEEFAEVWVTDHTGYPVERFGILHEPQPAA